MNRRRALMSVVSSSPAPVHGTWEDLFARIADGTYATAYSVGESFELDLGSTLGTVHMAISDFDLDLLASDTSKKAPVTLVATELLGTSKRFNPALSGENPYDEGTGTIGGWGKSEIRTWLRSTVYEAIPLDIRSHIVEVAKYSVSYNTSGTKASNDSSTDTVFIPSVRESGYASTGYNTGAETNRSTPYTALNSNTKRTKKKVGAASAIQWWTRSARLQYNNANRTTNAFAIATDGSTSSSSNNKVVTTALGVCLCFCVG